MDKKRVLSVIQKMENIAKAFCPTGPGGGVDPTCSPHRGDGGGGSDVGGLPRDWRQTLKSFGVVKTPQGVTKDELKKCLDETDSDTRLSVKDANGDYFADVQWSSMIRGSGYGGYRSEEDWTNDKLSAFNLSAVRELWLTER